MAKILAATLLLLAGALRVSAASDSVNLRFRFGKTETDMSALEALLSQGADGTQRKVSKVEICGASSPDGPYWVNKQIAEERVNSVKQKVMDLCPGLGDDTIVNTVIAEDWSGVKNWLKRQNKPWKEEALKIVSEGKASEREEKLQDLWAGEAWDDMMRSAFPALRAVKVTVVYEDASSAEAEPEVKLEVKPERKESDSSAAVLLFPAGIRYVQANYANNASVLELLRALLPDCKSVRIESYSSPEGDPACNMALAKKRAECARAYLVEHFGVAEDKITSEVKGEDWAGLCSEVQKNYKGDNRDELLGVLSNSSISDSSRKAAVRALDGGVTWRKLVATSMEGLRSVRIVCE